MNKQTSGRIGEQYAIDYLRKNGYIIVTANYTVRGGELDVVALKRGVLVFVEVKAKASTDKGEPATEITNAKTAALYRTAMQFIKHNGQDGKIRASLFGIPLYRRFRSIRFDLVELLVGERGIKRLIHTKNIIKTEN